MSENEINIEETIAELRSDLERRYIRDAAQKFFKVSNAAPENYLELLGDTTDTLLRACIKRGYLFFAYEILQRVKGHEPLREKINILWKETLPELFVNERYSELFFLQDIFEICEELRPITERLGIFTAKKDFSPIGEKQGSEWLHIGFQLKPNYVFVFLGEIAKEKNTKMGLDRALNILVGNDAIITRFAEDFTALLVKAIYTPDLPQDLRNTAIQNYHEMRVLLQRNRLNVPALRAA